jgi:glycosyltransferase involved in cell wall biosynthesis/SAM-dependent methyltransferase
MRAERLAVFGPLPPSRSGIADYLAEQVPLLQDQVELTVVVDDDQDLSGLGERYGALSILRVSDWEKQPRSDWPCLYHLGNNPDHAFVRRSLSNAGVVVLHDFIQHHLVVEETLGRGDDQGYRDLLAAELGGLGTIMADDRSHGVYSEFQQFLVPLNRNVIQNSRGVIVHSQWAKRSIDELSLDVPVACVPHHFAPPVGGLVGRDQARQELGIRQDELVLAALGYVTPPKQIGLLLQAMSDLRQFLPPFHLYLVGEPHDAAYWSDQIHRHGLSDVTTVTGYVALDRLFRYAEAADVIVNLRYPSAGETSGTLVRALGIGTACVVFDFGPFADYPDDVVAKVPLSTSQTGPLAGVIADLLLHPDRRARLAERASEHIRARHNLGACVDQYLAFITRCNELHRDRAAAPVSWSRASVIERRVDVESMLSIIEAQVASINATGWGQRWPDGLRAERLARMLSHVPVAEPGMAALAIGELEVLVPCLRQVLAYRDTFGAIDDPSLPAGLTTQPLEWAGTVETYRVSNGNLERSPLSIPSHTLDVAVCAGVIETLTEDPMWLLAEINRVLKAGGLLVLCTPNITSYRSIEQALAGHWPYRRPRYGSGGSAGRANLEYSPRELGSLLAPAGFSVSMETHNPSSAPPPPVAELVDGAGYSPGLRGDDLFAIAVKVSRVIERYPDPIYEDPGPVALQWADDISGGGR